MVNQVIDAMRGGNVLVAGAGVAGAGVARMLGDLECTVTVADDNVAAGTALGAETGAQAVDVAGALTQLAGGRIDLVVVSPGWRPDGPVPAAAVAAGVPVIGDVEAAWLADRAELFGAPRQWLAVTGTNGKTTTTAMLDAILQADGRRSLAVGNIGTPPGDALRADPRVDVLAAEVSSFQLHWAPSFAPDAGCVLNLAEDHLDWHGSVDNYVADKMRALTGQVAVIAADDPVVSARAAGVTGRRRAFTTGDPAGLPGEVVTGVREGRIIEVDTVTGQTTVLAVTEGLSPPGPAGVADAAAAAALARSIGVSASAVADALAGFRVQAHRGQVVADTGGVRWVDNSKATNPHAASAALRGLERVVWVAGGQLKGAAVDELVADVAPGLRAAVLLGVDRHVLAAALAARVPDLPVTVVDETEPVAAMAAVVAAARAVATPGDTVVLAPAAASLDMYPGMSRRGDLFAQFAGEDADR